MLYKNGNIFYQGQFIYGSFRVEGDIFAEVLGYVPDEPGIDLEGAYVIPGLVDVHNHGNSGADFSDGDYDGLVAIARHWAKCGVTSFAPASPFIENSIFSIHLSILSRLFCACPKSSSEKLIGLL